MLLDGLKLVLDNGWTVKAPEMQELCELCAVKYPIQKDEHFMQFYRFLLKHFRIEESSETGMIVEENEEEGDATDDGELNNNVNVGDSLISM